MTKTDLAHLTNPQLKNDSLLLLQKELGNYLSGTSSLPVAEAENLLKSLLFVLSHTPDNQQPIEEQLSSGKKQIKEQLKQTQQLYQQVLTSMLPLKVDAYWQTVRDIGAFFKLYDVDYHAHEVPVSIDYLLAQPVDDTHYQGVDFINQYLLHLYWENLFCSFYTGLEDLFLCYQQQLKVNYHHDINNLFRVIFKQVIAKKLIHSTSPQLILSVAEIKELDQLLRSTPTPPLLENSLEQLLTDTHISDSQYYESCLATLAVDLKHALKHEVLNLYFLTEETKTSTGIFVSHGGLSDNRFSKIIGELPHIQLERLPLFLADAFVSINDYLDLFNLEVLTNEEFTGILSNFDSHSLAILLRFAGKEVAESFSSFSVTLQALEASSLVWHQLLANYLLSQPHDQTTFKTLFQQINLPIDDFD